MYLMSNVNFLQKAYLILVLTEVFRNRYFTWNFPCSLFGLRTNPKSPRMAGMYCDPFRMNLSAEFLHYLFGFMSPQISDKKT